ncbi:MAG: peptidylprolyl isomerase [bacterium]
MSEIEIGKTVSLQYVVKLDDGIVIDQSDAENPLVFTIGDPNIIPGMVEAVVGMKEGEKKSFSVTPENAYGAKDPNFIRELPRNLFPDDMDIKVDDQLAAINKEGQEIPFCVVETNETMILADFNHPLAGKTLHFDIEIVEVTESAL